MRLVGVVVALEIWPARIVFTLDDSSGATIDVTCARNQPAPQDLVAGSVGLPISRVGNNSDASLFKGKTQNGNDVEFQGVDVGTVVKLKGTIGLWRSERQIQLERLWIVRSTAGEVAAWNENAVFAAEFLSRPWVMDENRRKLAERKAGLVGPGASFNGDRLRMISPSKTEQSRRITRRPSAHRSHTDQRTRLRRRDREDREKLKRERKAIRLQERANRHERQDDEPGCARGDRPTMRATADAWTEHSVCENGSEGVDSLCAKAGPGPDAEKQAKLQRELDRNERKLLHANRALKQQVQIR